MAAQVSAGLLGGCWLSHLSLTAPKAEAQHHCGCRGNHPSPRLPNTPRTDLKVQQLLQHLKENWGVSRHPEGLSHTPRILQANPSNSGIWHHFPGYFFKQRGGECSALLFSLAGWVIARDDEKHLQTMGNSIQVTSGELQRAYKGKSNWNHARSRSNHWMIFHFWQLKSLADDWYHLGGY